MTRAMGDVHPLGNPHYWLDPDNGRRMAKALADKFSDMRPADKAYFAEQQCRFRQTSRPKMKSAGTRRWLRIKGRKVITYHRSWPEFCERFGLEVVDYVEPKPGIPPTPRHTLDSSTR